MSVRVSVRVCLQNHNNKQTSMHAQARERINGYSTHTHAYLMLHILCSMYAKFKRILN